MIRQDLISVVDQQKKQISHYENKLRDLVRAYKALQKERDALQTGLNALNTSKSTVVQNKVPSTPSTTNVQVKEEAFQNDSETSTEQSEAESNKGAEQPISETACSRTENEATPAVEEKRLEEESNVTDLLNKLHNLTQALSDVTDQKETLHKNFMLERKKINEEKEKIIKDLKQSEEALRLTKANANELHEKYLKLQADRDLDADHASLRLRECQKLVSEQREAREKAEHMLQQAQHRLLQRSMHQTTPKEDSQQLQKQAKQISELKNTICKLESQVSSLEKELKAKDEKLSHIEQLQAITVTQLHQEVTRSQEAEAELARMTARSRERESELEGRLADAAGCVAASDTSLTSKLHHYKLRIRELSELNQELSSQLNCKTEPTDDSVPGDISLLMTQLKKLWLQVHMHGSSAAVRAELESLVGGSDLIHEYCNHKQNSLMQQIMEMQHKQKFMASGSMTASNSSENHANVENEALRAAREELRSVTAAAQVTESAHTAQIAQLKQECRNIRAEYEERLLSAQQSHRAVVCSLEQQLTTQRLHSIATLQERDVELHRLQQQVHSITLDNSQAKVPGALVCSTVTAARTGPLLHHIEELQRKEQEINALQHEKRQLQQAAREIEQASLEKRMLQDDRLAVLEMQVERFERNQSREGQNLEYLKNVLLHFLTNRGAHSRQALVKAVAAVLKLSPHEEDKLRRHTADGDSWWWWSASTAKK